MKIQFVHNRKAALFILLGLLVLVPTLQAWATFISPKRVTIEDRERTAKLTIHNGTDQTMAYRFEWERRAQKPDGSDVFLLKEGETSPGYMPADDMVQFSPRQVILKPGEHQKIRFLVRRPADLAAGEYHSHFLIKSERVPEPGQPQETGGQAITGTLEVRANVSIPVFLRQGKTNVNVTLKGASLISAGGKNAVRLMLDNDSTRSLYIKPELVCNNTDSVVLQSIKLYTEAKTLDDKVIIPKAFALDRCSSLKLKLMGTDDCEYNNALIAETDVMR